MAWLGYSGLHQIINELSLGDAAWVAQYTAHAKMILEPARAYFKGKVMGQPRPQLIFHRVALANPMYMQRVNPSIAAARAVLQPLVSIAAGVLDQQLLEQLLQELQGYQQLVADVTWPSAATTIAAQRH